jgi:hypothetical protein
MIHPVGRQPTNTDAIFLMQSTATDSAGDYKILALLINMQMDRTVPHTHTRTDTQTHICVVHSAGELG